MKKIRLILYGVGALGSRIARFLLRKEGVEIVGAIDIAEDKVGEDLGKVVGLGERVGVTVSDDPEAVFSNVKADAVVHATTSFLQQAYPQIAEALEHGLNVVSTCEELSYPYIVDRNLARKLHELARENGATVLGTGINPGFLMDTLVITLTCVCQKIRKIEIKRVMNAATRRVPFQEKIGAGFSLREFNEKMRSKTITGHVGLAQSMSMVASALGWRLDEIQIDKVEPVMAGKHVESDAIKVEVGQAAGLRQYARGIRGGKEVMSLEFQAYIGAEEEYDSITIEGVPNIYQKITPCIHGDFGTVAIIANSIPKAINAPPGLVTMKDLPIPSAALEDMRTYIER
jgi:hypothetical protein